MHSLFLIIPKPLWATGRRGRRERGRRDVRHCCVIHSQEDLSCAHDFAMSWQRIDHPSERKRVSRASKKQQLVCVCVSVCCVYLVPLRCVDNSMHRRVPLSPVRVDAIVNMTAEMRKTVAIWWCQTSEEFDKLLLIFCFTSYIEEADTRGERIGRTLKAFEGSFQVNSKGNHSLFFSNYTMKKKSEFQRRISLRLMLGLHSEGGVWDG